MCRRLHGAPGAYTHAPAASYRIRGEESLNWYRSSARAEQAFCRNCGSKLFWREVGGTILDVTMGSLDTPTGLRLGAHIWTRSQGDYYEIGNDGVPHYAESSTGQHPIPPEPGPVSGPQLKLHTGGCQCGAVTYRVAGTMRNVVVCHCGQCRRMYGHAPGFSAARKAELAIAGESEISWYAASDQAQRGHCRRCGSSLFWRPEGRDTVSITAGTLHTPTGLETVRHIFVAEKSDYYTIADAVPQSAGSMTGDPVTF
jgi:hypothetical protein